MRAGGRGRNGREDDRRPPARRCGLALGRIDVLPPGLSASLAILDLDHGCMRQRWSGGGAVDLAGRLTLAERAIKKAHELAGDEWHILRDLKRRARDDKSGELKMLGTRIVDRAAPWTVSDEIRWGAEPLSP